jgi:hypothetical protein
MGPLYQSLAQAAPAPEPRLDAAHPSVILFVIVSEKMQQAV